MSFSVCLYDRSGSLELCLKLAWLLLYTRMRMDLRRTQFLVKFEPLPPYITYLILICKPLQSFIACLL